MNTSGSRLRIGERRFDDVTILDLTGEISLDDGDLAFRRRVHELLDEGRLKILTVFESLDAEPIAIQSFAYKVHS